jgi:uncharacterized protein YjeT (DUF2065 family)
VNWSDLWAAIALYLVLEGIMPFLNPGGTKRTMLRMAQMDERSLRIAGLVSMIAGAFLLYYVRGAA